MNSLASFASASGRLGRRPFAIAVLVLYVVGFCSQVLLSTQVLVPFGLWPFTLAQGLLIWLWFSLHARRLHDAGRGAGTALGIAIICSLAVVLFILVLAVFLEPAATAQTADGSPPGIAGSLAVLSALAVLFTSPDLGVLRVVLEVVVVVALTPLALAFGYSIWAGTRPSVPASA